MKGYKAFNKNWKCRDKQYEVGKTYEKEKAELCKSGIHFCENPLDVLNYYDLCDSKFAEVEAENVSEEKSDDSKRVAKKVTIKGELTLKEFIEAVFNFVFEKSEPTSGDYSQLATSGDYSQLAASGYYSQLAASGNNSQLAASGNNSQLAASGDDSKLATSGNNSKLATSGYYSRLATSGNNSKLATSGDGSQLAASGHYSKLATSGDYSKLATSGNYSKLATSGYYSQLAASGHYSQLAASGYYSQLAASGYYSQLAASGNNSQLAASGNYSKCEVSGKNSIACSIGREGTARGAIGCWIVISEFAEDGSVICVKSTQVDGKIIKADTWYMLENEQFIEVVN